MKNLIKLWKANLKNKNRTYNDLKGFIKDINIWIAAYMKIANKKESLTPGADAEDKTLDKKTLNKLENLKQEVLEGKYQWEGSKRVLIKKSGINKKRSLSFPAASDKIVQEVLRIILEPLFELTFSEKSHGFRRERNCHTSLKMIDRDFKPVKWVIEGNINKYFEDIDHKTLIKKLKSKIKDKLIINLIKSGLKNNIIFNKTESILSSDIEIPQGGILSPLLSNIYYHEFDEFMDKFISNFDKGTTPKHNPIYDKLRRNKIKPKNMISYQHLDKEYRRLRYVRYADYFIIGVRASHKETVEIKNKIKEFLFNNLKIKLNEDKTKIIHINKSIKFLGHRIWRKSIYAWTKYYTKKGIVYRKTKHTVYALDGNSEKIIKRLKEKGIIEIKYRVDNKNKIVKVIRGIAYDSFLPYQQSEIINKYNSILIGLSEWWKYAGNRRRLLNYIGYLLKYSAAKTLAKKYNMSLKKIFTIANTDLSKPIKSYKSFGITDEKIAKWQKSLNSETSTEIKINPILFDKYSTIPGPEPIKFGKNWKPSYVKILEKNINKKNIKDFQIFEKIQPNKEIFSFLNVLTRGLPRNIKLLNAKCNICNSNKNVEIHHIKRVADIKGNTELEKRIKAFNSKQIPLCRKCHFSVHEYNWRNKPINPKNLPKK